MVWNLIRIGIFLASFLVGLMFFGSGASSAESKAVAVQGASEPIEIRCNENKLVLVRAGRPHDPERGIGMHVASLSSR